MEYYEVTILGPDESDKATRLIKTELPQAADAITRMLLINHPGLKANQTEITVKPITEAEAAENYPLESYTVRRRTPDGDMFVLPEGIEKAVLLFEHNPLLVLLPQFTGEVDCDGTAAKRVLRDAVATATDKDPNEVTWGDYKHAPVEILSKFGVYPQPSDITITLNANDCEKIFPETEYAQQLMISEKENQLVAEWLTNPEDAPNNTQFSKTVRYPTGMTMTVTCHVQNGQAWAEAELNNPDKQNGPIVVSESKDSFTGTWCVNYGDQVYQLTIHAEKAIPRLDAKRLKELHTAAYSKYKLHWLQAHNISIERLIVNVTDFVHHNKSYFAGKSTEYMVAKWEQSGGFSGAIWSPFSTFLRTEYKSRALMSHILNPAEFALWEQEQFLEDISV